VTAPHAAAVCGIGWRHPHHQELLARLPPLPFLEVHSENFFADGGAAPALLQAARAHYPISLHGVGLGLGSAIGLDPWHLEQLARLVERVEPLRVSDHACFACVGLGDDRLHAQDLLPIAFDDASLTRLLAHVNEVQDRLRRPLLVEHLSAYLRWQDDSLAEPAFFNELTRRSGCQLLLDVNNLLVNAKNRAAADPLAEVRAWIDALNPGSVGEIHVAGHAELEGLSIDDHGSAVSDAVWSLFHHAQRRLGPLPGLVEWDTAIPDLDTLLTEAARGDAQLV
jgi:uncharacterized protein (UPF0276 family)